MSIQTTLLEQQSKEQYNEGNYQEAYELLQEAISFDDTDDSNLLERAIDIAHEHLGLFEDVVNYANIILLQDEQNNRVRMQRAWSNYDLGQHEAAFDDFQYVIENSEDDKDVIYARSGRGLSYYMLNQYEEAVPELVAALEYYTEWTIGHAHLGWAYYYLREYKLARECFDRAIELSKEPYTYAYSGRGLVCYELYEYDQAIDDLSIGIDDNENWAQGYATRGWSYLDIRFHQNQYELAIKDFDKAISLQEKPYTYAYAGRGVAYYEMKNYEQAISDLEISLDDNKPWLRGFAVYGWSLIEIGKYEEALEPLNYAIENSKEGDYPFARAGRGIAYFELYRYKESKEDIEFALVDNQDWIRGKAVRAWILYEEGNTKEEFEAALEQFDEALKDIGDYPFGFGGRGLTHYELKQYQESVNDLNKSLTDDSKWARGYAVRGWSKYFLAEDKAGYLDAKADLDKAIEFQEHPNMFPVSGRGFVNYKLEDYEAAIEDLTAALEYYKDWKSGYIFLANSYNMQDKYDEAIKVYEQAKEQLPNEASLYHEEALLQEDQGDYKTAIANYEKAISLDPESWMYGSLAELYLRGLGTKQDYRKAYELFVKAYDMQNEKNDVDYFDATLINCYYQEFGVQNDAKRVNEIIEAAFENKNRNTEFILMMTYFYMNGIYVEQDEQKAKEAFTLAKKRAGSDPWVLFYDYVLNFATIDKEKQKQKIKSKTKDLVYGEYKKEAILVELEKEQPTLLYPLYEKP